MPCARTARRIVEAAAGDATARIHIASWASNRLTTCYASTAGGAFGPGDNTTASRRAPGVHVTLWSFDDRTGSSAAPGGNALWSNGCALSTRHAPRDRCAPRPFEYMARRSGSTGNRAFGASSESTRSVRAARSSRIEP
jgi:hypothetical protein